MPQWALITCRLTPHDPALGGHARSERVPAMVVLNKIYTRTGDDGTTALGSGERVPKNALRVAAYGTVDETNAAIGPARALFAAAQPQLDAMLARVQNDLF